MRNRQEACIGRICGYRFHCRTLYQKSLPPCEDNRNSMKCGGIRCARSAGDGPAGRHEKRRRRVTAAPQVDASRILRAVRLVLSVSPAAAPPHLARKQGDGIRERCSLRRNSRHSEQRSQGGKRTTASFCNAFRGFVLLFKIAVEESSIRGGVAVAVEVEDVARIAGRVVRPLEAHVHAVRLTDCRARNCD